MGKNPKRVLAGAITTAVLTFGAAGTAVADPGNSNGMGPGFCGGPPGQSGLVQFAKEIGVPPGQLVSHCNGHGHGAAQGGGGGFA